MNFRIKNRKRFRLLISLYILGWIVFCVVLGGVGSASSKAWTAITVVLIPAIFWQTNIEGKRLTKLVLLCYVFNYFLIFLGNAIALMLQGASFGFAMEFWFVSVVTTVLMIVASIFLLFFIVWKFGDISDYSKFEDVMTKEQHERFVKFIRKWEERFGKKRKRDE